MALLNRSSQQLDLPLGLMGTSSRLHAGDMLACRKYDCGYSEMRALKMIHSS